MSLQVLPQRCGSVRGLQTDTADTMASCLRLPRADPGMRPLEEIRKLHISGARILNAMNQCLSGVKRAGSGEGFLTCQKTLSAACGDRSNHDRFVPLRIKDCSGRIREQHSL